MNTYVIIRNFKKKSWPLAVRNFKSLKTSQKQASSYFEACRHFQIRTSVSQLKLRCFKKLEVHA
jgi:hypothetical protein